MKKISALLMVFVMVFVSSDMIYGSNLDELKDSAKELLEEAEGEKAEEIADFAEEKIDEFDLETYLTENEETLWVIYDNRILIRGLEVDVVTKSIELQAILQEKMYSYVPLTKQEIAQIQALYNSYNDEIEALKNDAQALKETLKGIESAEDLESYNLEDVILIQAREIEALQEMNYILEQLINILS